MKNTKTIQKILITLCTFYFNSGITPLSAQKADITKDSITMTKEKQQRISPQQALQKLKDGNTRFVSGKLFQRNLI